MSEVNINKLVGDSFEDMSIAEMTLVQGSGDIEPKTTPGCLISITQAITAFTASWTVSQEVTKTIKGNC